MKTVASYFSYGDKVRVNLSSSHFLYGTIQSLIDDGQEENRYVVMVERPFENRMIFSEGQMEYNMP